MQFVIFIIGTLFSSIVHSSSPQVSALCPFNANMAKNSFAQELLQEIPISELENEFKEIEQRLGTCKEVKQLNSKSFDFIYTNGVVNFYLYFTKNGKISNYQTGEQKLNNDSFDIIVNDFKKFSPTSSILLTEGKDKTLLAHNSKKSLPIGLNASLLIMGTLMKKLGGDPKKLNQTVSLKESMISYSPSIISRWPLGTPLTLATLINLSSSESDLTAIDTLIQRIGIKELEAAYPSNRPFLTTREFFLVQAGFSASEKTTYKKLDLRGKRKLLQKKKGIILEDKHYNLNAFDFINIGWFASTQELCSIVMNNKENPYLGNDPGALISPKWQKAVFRGGRFLRVLQHTYYFKSKRSKKEYCLSISITDEADFEQPVNLLTQRVSGLIN